MELDWQAFTGVAGSVQLIIFLAVALMPASDSGRVKTLTPRAFAQVFESGRRPRRIIGAAKANCMNQYFVSVSKK
jgi:hypothetical protein